jgi:xanthine dehydrogenase accessory factor
VAGAVYELCQQILADDGTLARARFGHSDDAFAIGLTCGGEIDVLVQRVDRTDRPHLTMLRTLVRPWSRTASNAIHSPPWAASDLLSMPHPLGRSVKRAAGHDHTAGTHPQGHRARPEVSSRPASGAECAAQSGGHQFDGLLPGRHRAGVCAVVVDVLSFPSAEVGTDKGSAHRLVLG